MDHAQGLRCPYLLNDNVALQGPWFDSLEWLEHAWLPKAQQVGLRFVAHVVQADTGTDILTRTFSHTQLGQIELQVFDRLPEAQEWLRTCRRASQG